MVQLHKIAKWFLVITMDYYYYVNQYYMQKKYLNKSLAIFCHR